MGLIDIHGAVRRTDGAGNKGCGGEELAEGSVLGMIEADSSDQTGVQRIAAQELIQEGLGHIHIPFFAQQLTGPDEENTHAGADRSHSGIRSIHIALGCGTVGRRRIQNGDARCQAESCCAGQKR